MFITTEHDLTRFLVLFSAHHLKMLHISKLEEIFIPSNCLFIYSSLNDHSLKIHIPGSIVLNASNSLIVIHPTAHSMADVTGQLGPAKSLRPSHP